MNENPTVIEKEKSPPESMKIVEFSSAPFQVMKAQSADTLSLARKMLQKQQMDENQLWRVNANDKLDENITQKVATADTQITGDIDRLKVATLIACLADETAKQFILDKTVVVLNPQNIYDFKAILNNPQNIVREIAVLKRHSREQLSNIFKTILTKLLEGFDDNRFDRQVLQFVANYNAFDLNFDYNEKMLALAKQYVYSALYDGYPLQFNNNTCVETLVITDGTRTESQLPTTKPNVATSLENIMVDVERKTAQIFQSHKTLNDIIAICGKLDDKNCAAEIDAKLSHLCQLFKLSSDVSNLFRRPPMNYATRKNIEKVTRLCCLALTNKFVASKKTLTKIATCGFFDDITILASILDSGCLQFLSKRDARLFLLEKLAPHVNEIIVTAHSDKENVGEEQNDNAKNIVQMQRILWLLYVVSVPATKTEFKTITGDASDQAETHTALGVDVLQKIYIWLKNNETANVIAARHKTIHNYLLRHNQFYFATAAQQEFNKIFQ